MNPRFFKNILATCVTLEGILQRGPNIGTSNGFQHAKKQVRGRLFLDGNASESNEMREPAASARTETC